MPTTEPPAVDRRLAAICCSLCALGPRCLYEIMRELCAEHPAAGAFLVERARVYNRLDPDVVEGLVGRNGFPAPPIHEI